jgi:hypothetical protein
MSVQYASGTKVHNTFLGQIKADLLANTLSSLLAAGWSLVNGVTPSVVTISIANPGVVTLAAHGLAAGTRVTFNTTGSLPSGLSPNTTYYVLSPTTNTFELSLSSGGSAITTSLTQSGVHTMSSEILMQTATTPQGYNLRCRFRDNNGISVQYSIETSDGVYVGGNTTNDGGSLTPGLEKTWHIVANKFQFFMWVNASYITGNEFVVVSCPYCFSFMSPAYLGFMLSGSRGDSSNNAVYAGNWRWRIDTYYTGDSARGYYQVIYDHQFNDWGNTATTGSDQGRGFPGLIPYVWWWTGNYMQFPNIVWRWANGDALTQDAIMCWGLTAPNDEPQIRCQLWDCIIIQDEFFGDTTTSFDSHNWIALNSSVIALAPSTLFIVTP